MTGQPITTTIEQVRQFRLRRSGLIKPFASPETAASSLFGVQAQILPAAAVALWNRTRDLTYARFESLLFEQRTLVKLWGQRGTLHLYPSAEWPLLHGALQARATYWERQARKEDRLDQYQAMVARVADLLRQKQVMGRSDLRTADLDLHEDFFSSWGGIFADLVRHGHACHAGAHGNEGLFAAREYWLPQLVWSPPPADEANVTVLRRYLRAYGPATVQDFAYWRGATVRDGRRWLAAIAPETAVVRVDGAEMALLAVDVPDLLRPAEPLPPLLLYRFDPLLLAHRDKSWLIDMTHHKQVWRAAGHIEGTVLENGRIQATWRYQRGSAFHVTVDPFLPLAAATETAVAAKTEQLSRFFGFAGQ